MPLCKRKCSPTCTHNLEDPPVRDNAKKNYQDADFEKLAKRFPPPKPPREQYGQWELEFCNLWGWNWVRRDDKNYKPGRDKKPKHLLCCFKKQTSKEESADMYREPVKNEVKSCISVQKQYDSSRDNYQCCCCCCSCCNDLNGSCCQCMQPCSCMCQNDESEYNRAGNEGSFVQKCKSLKCMETQTCNEVKEKATKMSNMQIAKHKSKQKNRCRCCMRRCCCMRTVCCPCVQNNCCPCAQNNKIPNNNSNKSTDKDTADQIVNLCLTSNSHKPNLNDFFNFKSSNYSALHKSLDILLKNNTNVMNLISENKELKKESTSPNFLDLNQSISCLSFDNNNKRSNDEHRRLLTAVCDAILSSHKFDNEGFSSYQRTSSTSMDKSYSDSKVSQTSQNFFRNAGILERILNDLHFPPLLQKTKSADECNLQKEIGIQVNSISAKKSDRAFHTTRMTGKLPRCRSRTLTAPRILKKYDIVRYPNLVKINCKKDSKTFETNKNGKLKNNGGEIKTISQEHENISRKFLPLNFGTQPRNSSTAPRVNSSPQLHAIEQLLASVDFNVNSNLQNTACKSPSPENANASTAQDNENINLLDATSPPFTEYDSPFNTESNRHDANADHSKTYFGG